MSIEETRHDASADAWQTFARRALRGFAWTMFVLVLISWLAPDYSGPWLTLAIVAPMPLSIGLDAWLDRR